MRSSKARFKRRILHAPNAIQTMHNEEAYLIIYCLNCIRCMQNSTFETGLTVTTAPPPNSKKATCISLCPQQQTNVSVSKGNRNNSYHLLAVDQHREKQNIENHGTTVLPCIQCWTTLLGWKVYCRSKNKVHCRNYGVSHKRCHWQNSE